MVRSLLVTLLLGGCVFNTAGNTSDSTPGSDGWIASDTGTGGDHAPSDLTMLDQTTDQNRSDQTGDQATPDQATPDQATLDQATLDQAAPDQATPDQATPDQAAPDQTAPVDQSLPPDKGTIVPISTSALGQAFANTTVQCVLYSGQVQSNFIPVADSSSVSFFDGSVTLAGALQPTVSWVGGLPSVIVVWNPNACDWEDPANLASNWASAGLLVRGATINGSGQLVLQPGATIQDINILNVNSDGTFQDDYFLPDDSELPNYPQLVKPVTKAKELILQLGNA